MTVPYLLGCAGVGDSPAESDPAGLGEDFRDGFVLDGVRFLNPFARAFDPDILG